MLERPGNFPSPADVLLLNLHWLATELDMCENEDPQFAELQAAVEELQPQLQLWAATQLELLLQPALLYSTAYAAAGADGLRCQARLFCRSERDRAAASAGSAVETGSSEQAAGVVNGNANLSPALPPGMREEMLLLILTLLQNLQQGKQQRSATSSSSSAVPAAAAAPIKPEFASTAETILTGELLELLQGVHAAVSVYAAPAAPGQAILPLLDAEDTQEHTTANTAAAAATAGDATAEGTGGKSAAGLPALWQHLAGAVYTALEVKARSQSRSAPTDAPECCGRDRNIAALCLIVGGGTAPLLALQSTQGVSGEQQMRVEFFRLTVSMLKLAAALGPCDDINLTLNGLDCLFTGGVARDAARALTALAAGSAAPDSPGGALKEGSSDRGGGGDARSISSSEALWLLLLGRCCLLWAAELRQADEQRASWAQVIQETQRCHLAPESDSSKKPPHNAMFWCFGTTAPWLLRFADELRWLLQEGSSLDAGLSAAGYDVGPIEQDLDSLSACYPGVAETEGVPAAVVAERVGGLIRVLVSLVQALSMFAVPYCCNNPCCVNISGLTEKGIV